MNLSKLAEMPADAHFISAMVTLPHSAACADMAAAQIPAASRIDVQRDLILRSHFLLPRPQPRRPLLAEVLVLLSWLSL